MGCGASKGKSDAEPNVSEVNFKPVGVPSIDAFFDKCKEVLDSFKDITGPLGEQKDNFYEATGFYEQPGSEVKHAFLGMFYSLVSLVKGDMSALGIEWKTGAPMVEIRTDDIGEAGVRIYESFVAYAMALEKCVTEQLPAVLENAQALVGQVEEVREGATPEFNELDLMKKGKALLATGFNVKSLGKIPGFIKSAIEGFKSDLNELKDAIMELKMNLPKVKAAGTTCAQSDISQPVPCYKHIHGPIKYTQDQRTEWESKMQERADRLGIRFWPSDYPTTDMIAETTA
eukprot:403348343